MQKRHSRSVELLAYKQRTTTTTRYFHHRSRTHRDGDQSSRARVHIYLPLRTPARAELTCVQFSKREFNAIFARARGTSSTSEKRRYSAARCTTHSKQAAAIARRHAENHQAVTLHARSSRQLVQARRLAYMRRRRREADGSLADWLAGWSSRCRVVAESRRRFRTCTAMFRCRCTAAR